MMTHHTPMPMPTLTMTTLTNMRLQQRPAQQRQQQPPRQRLLHYPQPRPWLVCELDRPCLVRLDRGGYRAPPAKPTTPLPIGRL